MLGIVDNNTEGTKTIRDGCSVPRFLSLLNRSLLKKNEGISESTNNKDGSLEESMLSLFDREFVGPILRVSENKLVGACD